MNLIFKLKGLLREQIQGQIQWASPHQQIHSNQRQQSHCQRSALPCQHCWSKTALQPWNCFQSKRHLHNFTQEQRFYVQQSNNFSCLINQKIIDFQKVKLFFSQAQLIFSYQENPLSIFQIVCVPIFSEKILFFYSKER